MINLFNFMDATKQTLADSISASDTSKNPLLATMKVVNNLVNHAIHLESKPKVFPDPTNTKKRETSPEVYKGLKRVKKEVIRETRYWLNVVSLEHVMRGVEGGFTQACHGKESALRKMQKNDGIIHYSPKEKMGSGAVYKKFTSIGRIADDTIYKVDMGGGFTPFRCNVLYEKNITHVAIDSLLNQLSFSKDRGRNWGIVLRAGLISISKEDFELISKKMIRGVIRNLV